MPRYIDADKKIHIQIFDNENEEYIVLEQTIAECLDSYTDEGCPEPVDIHGVRHGHWIKPKPAHKDYETGYYECSVCFQLTNKLDNEGYPIGTSEKHGLPNFCPYCGSKMDEEI